MSTTWTIGTFFTYNGGAFRATGFLKVETYALVPDDA